MEFRDTRHRQVHLEAGALSDILFFLLIIPTHFWENYC